MRRILPDRTARGQRGIVLFIALIAMVVLSLAGVALMRSVSTANAVAGNLALRQASIAPVNNAVERAVLWLFGDLPVTPPAIPNRNLDDAAHRYFATLQAGELPNGVPALLAGPYPPAGYTFGVDVDPTGAEVRSVIERVCRLTTGGVPPTEGTQGMVDNCDMIPPIEALGGTDNETGRPPLPPIPHYRLTVRVDIPNTNTVTFAQAMLR